MDAILPVKPSLPSGPAASSVAGESSKEASGFGDSLNKLIEAVDSSTATANNAVDKMLNGTGDVHDAMIALQRSELTMQLTVQVRNKLVQAYQDIMRMPV